MKTFTVLLAILFAFSITLPVYAGDDPPGDSSDFNRLIRLKEEQEAKLREYLKSIGSAQDEAMEKLKRDNERMKTFRIIPGGKGTYMDSMPGFYFSGIITYGPYGMSTPGCIGMCDMPDVIYMTGGL